MGILAHPENFFSRFQRGPPVCAHCHGGGTSRRTSVLKLVIEKELGKFFFFDKKKVVENYLFLI